MAKPAHFELEKKLWQKGVRFVAGIDEVGRGSWAGPVVAAAVIFPQNFSPSFELADSKQLTSAKRETLDKAIRRLALAIGIGESAPERVDAEGIVAATTRAFEGAVKSLKISPEYLLIDYFVLGSFDPDCQEGVKNGDAVCASIAAASVVAKVYRDALMRSYDNNTGYSCYQFGKHKGYGTKQHRDLITRYGLSAIHRRTFVSHVKH